MVNHRVNIASSTEETAEHIYNTLLPAAKSLNLAITGFGESHIPSKTPRGHIFLSEAYEHGHGPAPISPTDLGTEAWKVLAGTARGMWASRPEVSEDGSIMQLDEEDELVMTPYMGTGVSLHR
jgi:Gly-Xaa carboxypeptidase